MKDKKIKYSINSSVIVAGAVIVAILVNMILVTFDSKIPLKISFVRDEIYRLTEETEEIVDKIDKDTKITILFSETGNAEYDSQYSEILKIQQNIIEKYCARNEKITYEVIDFVTDYMKLATTYSKAVTEIKNPYCAMIFTQDERYEVSEANSYITEDNKSDIERVITNKLATFVDGFSLSSVIMTEGHGEMNNSGFISVLEHYNYKTETIDLLKNDLPEDNTSLVIINSPKADFSDSEIEKLDLFLERGGNVQIYFDPMVSNDELPRLENYLKDVWAIERNHNIVIDMDNRLIQDDKNFGFLAVAGTPDHEVVSPIASSNRSIMYSTSNAIEILGDKSSSTDIKPLLISSKNAYLKDKASVSESKTSDDTSGEFNLAVTAKRETYNLTGDKKAGKLLVSGSGFTWNTLISDTRFANEDMLINSINWMRESEAGVTVRAKELPKGSITVPNGHYWPWFIAFVVVLPLAVLACGFVVFSKRRYK